MVKLKPARRTVCRRGPQAQRLPPAAALEFRWLSLPPARKPPPPVEAAEAEHAWHAASSRRNQNAGAGEMTCNKPYNSAMAPPALFKNFGKASADLFKDDDWSATHKLDISNKNAQQSLTASVDAAGKSE